MSGTNKEANSGLCFQLSEEQLDLKKWAHGFAEKEIRPIAAEYDEKEEFPMQVLEKAAKAGLTSYAAPVEYGGGGADQRDGCLPDCRGVVLGVRGNCHIPDGGRVGRITSLLYGNGRTKKEMDSVLV